MRRSDLDDLVGARGEQGSRRGLVVHVNNAVLAVVEGCRGSSTATDKQNGGCFSDASMQTKLRMCNDLVHSWKPEGEWVLPTLRQWWTRGSCHTRAPRTRSPSGGWWNVWTNTCHTLPAHTSCSGAEGHNCTFTATKMSLIVFFFFGGGVQKTEKYLSQTDLLAVPHLLEIPEERLLTLLAGVAVQPFWRLKKGIFKKFQPFQLSKLRLKRTKMF